ncbi:unnamed protein product [Peronospora effusa]|nr:unnamed protein product [Peronospora effusa]
MSSDDGVVPLGDAASSLKIQGAQVQWKQVPGPGPAAAGRVSFATSVNGLGNRIDPDERIDPGVPNGPGGKNDPGEPTSLGNRKGSVDHSASTPAEVGGSQDRRALLVRTASRPWIDKVDDDLRPMIPLEEEALAAWLMGGIVLPSPPGFLVCTHPRATRVAMLDLFEEYLEGKVIALVPPSVRMPQHIAEKTLLLQLLERREGETTSDPLSRELVNGAKRTCYNSDTRRLTFILPDQAAAASWHTKFISFRGTRLQLLCPATMERDDITTSLTSSTTSSRTILQYQVRILVHGVAASTVQAILSSSVSCSVTSVVRGFLNGTEAYDSNFFVATFNTVSCPEEIKLVTHIKTPNTTLFIHHHRHFQRVPCFSCYSPYHSSAKCAAPAASGDAPRAAGPTTDGWFDPGANKKKRDSRPNAASTTQAATSNATPLRRPRSKAAEGTSKSSTQGSASTAKQSATNSVKVATKPSSPTKPAVSTKGRAPAATYSVTSAATNKATKQRAQAVAELDYLIGGDRTASTANQATDTVAVLSTSEKSSKVTALAVAQSQVADAQRTV